ncbi:MAG TPA: hypothetical protein VLY20_09895 [Nitrospiria bacterium]|nr:hypothetical protein [Nitrospiria bacterium]
MRWRIKSKSLLLIKFCLILSAQGSFAYSIPTHQDITRSSVLKSNIDGYIRTNLAIPVNSLFMDISSGRSQTYDAWIVDGSAFEDYGSRSRNHFHNPLTNAGLSDVFSGKSAVDWAISDPENEWSWTNTRTYFYNALISETKTERNDQFAKMFRALGQVVHLVQDSSVPEHVRNDQHLISAIPVLGAFGYEPWILGHVNPLSFSATTFSFPPNFQLRSFWDTDTYVDSPLQQGPLTGLAEYTNYNFFSEDTIFTERFSKTDAHYFPHPRKEFTDAILKEEIAEDGQTDQVYYVHGYQANLLATVSYTSIYIPPLTVIEGWQYNRDPNVYQEYAGRLIPMAISYSAGLLDYFFRGQIEVTPVQDGLKVKNVSSETMDSYFDLAAGGTIGDLSVYYDDLNITRQYLVDYPLSAPLNPGQEISISFPRPADNIKPGRYIVVFRGKLGQEEGAVIGAVTPAPLYYVSKRAGVYKIFRMDADGSNQELVYDNPDPNITISKLAPSPDGKTLAFTVDGPRIYLLDIPTGALTEFTQGDWPDWSPDGSKIVFERDVTPPEGFVSGVQIFSVVEIFARDVSSGNEVQLTHTYPPIDTTAVGSFNGHPAFSPDGSRIAYTRWPPDPADCNNPTSFVIYLMDASGNSIGPVTCDPQRPWLDAAPAWSPDGREIAFLRRWDQQFYQLQKVPVGTKDIAKLTNSDGTVYSELTPAWSSDGKYIAIGSNQDGDFDIWLVSPNGGYLNNLTSGNTDMDGFPAYAR